MDARQEMINKIYDLVKSFKKYDVTDDYGEALEGLVTELVDQGIRSKEGFEIAIGAFLSDKPDRDVIVPIDYKQEEGVTNE